MERFKLVFLGERVGPHASLPLEKHMSMLPFASTTIEKLRCGKPLAIKSNLELTDAMSVRAKLEKIGLATELRLQLSAECFELGVQRNDVGISMAPVSISARNQVVAPTLAKDRISPVTKGNLEKEVMELAPLLARPLVARKPDTYKISSKSTGESISLKASSFKFGDLFIIGLCVYFALTLQTYVTLLVAYYGPSHTFASIISVIFLILLIFCFPKIMQPLDVVEVADRKTDEMVEMVERQTFLLGGTKWYWTNQQGDRDGEMSINAKQATFESSNGKEYYWDSTAKLEESSEEALDNIQDAILDGSPLDSLISMFELLKKAVGHLGGGNATKKTNWKSEPATVIVDEAGAPVALVYQAPNMAYKIIRDASDDDLDLSVFCISVLRAGLV